MKKYTWRDYVVSFFFGVGVAGTLWTLAWILANFTALGGMS